MELLPGRASYYLTTTLPARHLVRTRDPKLIIYCQTAHFVNGLDGRGKLSPNRCVTERIDVLAAKSARIVTEPLSISGIAISIANFACRSLSNSGPCLSHMVSIKSGTGCTDILRLLENNTKSNDLELLLLG